MRYLPSLNNCKIAIIGLGYVGLPVAIEFSKRNESLIDKSVLNRKIIGFDIKKSRIDELKMGIDKTNEVTEEELNKTNIQFTSDKESLEEANVFIVTVPTPIDWNKIPDLTLLEKACKTIGASIRNGPKFESIPVVIFESTVYPGATEEVCIPIIENESGLSLYSDSKKKNTFACGYSPERINPGDKKHRISSIKKVTSGNNNTLRYYGNGGNNNAQVYIYTSGAVVELIQLNGGNTANLTVNGESIYDYTLLVDQDGNDTCNYTFNRNDQTADTTVQLTNSGC